MILVSEVGEGNQQEGGICQDMSSGQAWEEKERKRVENNNQKNKGIVRLEKRKISQMLSNQNCQTLLLAVARTHFVSIAFWNVLCFHLC